MLRAVFSYAPPPYCLGLSETEFPEKKLTLRKVNKNLLVLIRVIRAYHICK